MDMLRKFWPTPFKIEKGNTNSLVVQLIIFVVVCAVFGWVIGFLANANIPVISLLFSLVGSVFEIYGVVGIVLSVLKYFGVID